MKKLLIVLSFLGVFLITPIKANAYYGYEYGGYMELTHFEMLEYYQYTGTYDTNGTSTYIFKYITYDITLNDFTAYLGDSVPNFMVLWNINNGYNYKYINNPNDIPTDNIAWSIDDGVLCIIVKQSYIIGEPDLMIEYIVNNINIQTWIIYNPNQDYVRGYNDGYENGYNEGYEEGESAGFNDGWDEGYYNGSIEGFELGEQAGYLDGYDVGHEDGYIYGYNYGYNQGHDVGYSSGLQASQSEAYQDGYLKGAEESFISNFDKWIVPAIIIIMIVGGFFAVVRRKREG